MLWCVAFIYAERKSYLIAFPRWWRKLKWTIKGFFSTKESETLYMKRLDNSHPIPWIFSAQCSRVKNLITKRYFNFILKVLSAIINSSHIFNWPQNEHSTKIFRSMEMLAFYECKRELKILEHVVRKECLENLKHTEHIEGKRNTQKTA